MDMRKKSNISIKIPTYDGKLVTPYSESSGTVVALYGK